MAHTGLGIGTFLVRRLSGVFALRCLRLGGSLPLLFTRTLFLGGLLFACILLTGVVLVFVSRLVRIF